MSKIALSGNASGTGTLTIASQNTNSNYTLTIPNETGTLTTTASTPTFTGAVTAPGFIPNSSTVVSNGLYLPAANAVGIATNTTNAVYINSSGNVGVGTSSPTDSAGFGRAFDISGTAGSAYYSRTNASGTDYALFGHSGTTAYLWNISNGALTFATNNTERARITSGGDLLVGSTSVKGTSGSSINFGAGNGGCSSVINSNLANNGTLDISFRTDGGGWMGILMVSNSNNTNANIATRTIYAVLGRGTTCTFTSLATQNGSGGAFSFSMSCPSNGVMRVTNTGGSASETSMVLFSGISS